jgi:plasmid stabilization system protein ParE
LKLVYSAQAVADLVRLRTFIAEIDPSAAARVAAELISRIENIRRFPEIGRDLALAPEPHAVREVIFGKYIARYSVHAAAIVILRIWHHYENREQSI